MRDHAIVSPRFWTGKTGLFLRDHPDAQRLALYLMTCPSSNMIGLYYLPIPTICHELRLTQEGASKGLLRLKEGAFADYDGASETVFVYEMARFQLGEKLRAGDKRIPSVVRLLEQHRNSRFYKAFAERYGAAFNLRLKGHQTKEGSPFEGAYEGSRSDQDQDQDQETDSSEPGRSVVSNGFDPLKESERNRKAFEAAWNAAGLRKLTRLTHTLHGRLDALLLNNEWAATWREALTRAGQIPFLASGSGRQQGPLDPSEFLRDDDFAASILRGKFDPRQAAPKSAAPNGKTFSTDPFRELIEAELAAQQGAAS